jgi:hypothetical protein
MPTTIAHDGRLLLITIELGDRATTYYINKQQIRLIEYHDEETIRINMGEGPLKPVYIRASDVTTPAGLINAKLVRAYLSGLCKNDDTATSPTLENQLEQSKLLDEINGVLGDIKTALTVYNPANIFNQPLIMDSITPGTVYYGYAVAGTAVNAAGWAIKRVVTSGGVTNILWSNGNLNLSNSWNNRAAFTYAYVAIT